jgi:hypothetical protein
MKCTYVLRLVRREPTLDLRPKRKAIEQVVGELLAVRSDLLHCEVSRIEKHDLELSVDETGKSWHPLFGKKLANEKNMRPFCHPKDSCRLFIWKLASSPA